MASLFVELHFKCVVGIYCSPNVEAKLIIYSSTSKFMHVARTFKEFQRKKQTRLGAMGTWNKLDASVKSIYQIP